MRRLEYRLLAEWVSQQDPSVEESLADFLEHEYTNFDRKAWDKFVNRERERYIS